MKPKILLTGATGQIGSELTPLLRERYGSSQVVAGVHHLEHAKGLGEGPQEVFDVKERATIERLIKKHGVDTVYHLGAVLSAVGEKDPQLAWEVNMQGLKNVLDASLSTGVSKVFWPSSIAVFGPDAPRSMAPQGAALNPTTMYGVTKVAGELLCNYYYLKFGLDTRILRYPGLISSMTPPGGGTTDYAVAIFYAALRGENYQCFVREDTVLPMMYMPDALDATVRIMEADPTKTPRHMGYNLAAISFSAGELASEIRKRIPAFHCTYSPDSRQKIADSWPMSIDDKEARRDWGWSHRYDLERMAKDMVEKLGERVGPAKKSG
ncbi:MAG: NAD-dependent epimerase/dehydratase family protein [Nitrososphaerales archaeon]|nr:NAD-dependent epimerase/dehydratase family protein [Nitrososphaerales archaeon]